MPAVVINDLVDALISIPTRHFDFGTVAQCLRAQPVESQSLQPYLFFNAQRVTRNLIFKNDQFELLALCWEVGQSSAIQAFPGLNCWLIVSTGLLRLRTFRVMEEDVQKGSARVEEAVVYDLKKHSVAVIAGHDPVHQLQNVSAIPGRAVSLHLYSPPVTSQVTYSLKENRRTVGRLGYDSRHGRSS